ncbi:hypothetical protein [Streptomyces albipurpureus]|uniref:DUF4878 domain-containing protein n=1 Tax=Streptomyces albipurpureus TaxID=2897419 RepID=A0ABT0UJ34_9ACTN|nr:hypothetical protein [Streptomyces sp. CWNU-1]MCM2388351.1 hypothetical protein [Streptomyces sp. CWNU-1]
MSKLPRRVWIVAVVLTLCIGGGATAWWLLRAPAPYSLRDTPEVDVTVRAEKSTYPDVDEVAREAELVIKAYVQRLESGDPVDIARLGTPWYTGKEQAAKELISRYGTHADAPVEAVVFDPVVPNQAAVSLQFAGGRQQRLDLTRDDGVWWLDLGTGDPMNP